MLSVSAARGAFVFVSAQNMTAELKVIEICNCDYLHNEYSIYTYMYIYVCFNCPISQDSIVYYDECCYFLGVTSFSMAICPNT